MTTNRTCFRNIGELIQVDKNSKLKIRNRCALVVHNGRVKKIIRDSAVTASDYSKIVDLNGTSVIPGLVDCHTHLIHAGQRKEEMEARARGDSYMEILKSGGGIHATVEATRKASEPALFRAAEKRMERMMTLGTTAFEIKSGYGLNLETEMKMLRVGRRLRDRFKVPLALTYLGAHAVPRERDKYEYLNDVIANLRQFCGLADAVDIFCERDVFSAADLRRLFLQAKLLGFHLRAHVEELSRQGGCFEAARLGALSCDHLEHANPTDIRAMKLSGAVAVLMPGVTFFLGGGKLPLAHTMLDAGVPIALATDCNPGSCPSYNMQTVLYLAASLYRLTPDQALAAATRGSARALNGGQDFGGLLPGERADFLALTTGDYRDLFYYFGENFVNQAYSAGKPVKRVKNPFTTG
ncbi:MAG: imidazolonepropionase [Nitrospinales bacterium]